MAGEKNYGAEFDNLRATVVRQGTTIEFLQKRVRAAEEAGFARAAGVALLVGLLATTMGGWLMMPIFTGTDEYPSSVDSYGLWNIGGALHQTVGGQTFATIAVLLLVLAVGAYALADPTSIRLNFLGGGAVLLLASEIWLRIGISGVLASEYAVNSNSFDETFKSVYAYGGGALTLAFVVTALLSVWSFQQATVFRDPPAL